MVFTADSEVWSVPAAGGRARRPTDDRRARVGHLCISPDAALLAWTSSRDGVPEVYAAPLDGGPPRRLTHFGHARTRVAGWTPQGEVPASRSLCPSGTNDPEATCRL
ncbi:hypothetical protein OHB13_36020 [Streptomyces sp. NBC_00440]|uniref:hypothetical protein n=1 Tax=Streptomyces sp. NBC_00440 TaxID=2975741 RepID=UPI002E228EDC